MNPMYYGSRPLQVSTWIASVVRRDEIDRVTLRGRERAAAAVSRGCGWSFLK